MSQHLGPLHGLYAVHGWDKEPVVSAYLASSCTPVLPPTPKPCSVVLL